MSKKISGIDWTPIILVAAAVGGVWYVFKNGNPFASSANSGNNASIDSNTTAAASSTLATLQSQGQTPDLSQAQASSIATVVYNEGLDGSDSAMNQIESSIIQCFNDADYYLVMQMFGTKQAATSVWSTCALLGFNCQAMDLTSWLKAVLDSDHREAVNEYFAASGMTVRI
jgi:hypothetical protein